MEKNFQQGFVNMDSRGFSFDEVSSGNENRLISAQLVNLHVYLVPPQMWRYHLQSALDRATHDAISLGFVRVLPQTTIRGLRNEISKQLEFDSIPKEFVFLNCVGRCFTKIKSKQEKQLKVKNFIPPQAPTPEIFILESNSELYNDFLSDPSTSSASSSIISIETGNFSGKERNRMLKLPPIGQPLVAGSSNKGAENNRRGNTKPLPSNDNKNLKNSLVNKMVADSNEQEEGDEDYDNDAPADDDDDGRCEEIEDDEITTNNGSRKMGMLPAGRIIFEFFKAVAINKKKARNGQHADDKIQDGLPNIPQTTGFHDSHKKTEEKHRNTNIPKPLIVHHKMVESNEKPKIKDQSSTGMTFRCSGYCSDKVLCVFCPECMPMMDEENNEHLEIIESEEQKRRMQMEEDRKKKEEKALLEELKLLKKKRREGEKFKEELMSRKKALLAALKNSEKKTANRDTWKKKYFMEKKRTPQLEESNKKLKKQLESLNRKLIFHLEQLSGMNSTRQKNQNNTLDKQPEGHEMTLMHLEAAKLKMEVESFEDKMEQVKLKLSSELKLRMQVEDVLRSLKLELEQRKAKHFNGRNTMTEEISG